MRVIALISGGKDSTYNMMQCIAAGHQIVAVANVSPEAKTEIDSYMYQSVGHEAIDLIAEALQLPLFQTVTKGNSIQRGRIYTPVEDDEVEDLYNFLAAVKSDVDFDAISVGAILSDYQRVRVENVCIRLNVVSLSYLWQRNQKELLAEMIKCEIDAIIVKVAALGLEPQRHLGRSLRLVEPQLHDLHEKYGINVCGEGGEYETLTLDCPLYKSRIVIDEFEIILHSEDTIAQVGFLKLNKLHLELKLPPLDLEARMTGLPLKDSDGYVTDLAEDADASDEETCSEEPTPINQPDQSAIAEQITNSAKSSSGWLWTGGICGNPGSAQESMKSALEKLKLTLIENGHELTDLCSINMFVSNMSLYAELNKAYCEMLSHVNPPSRACVEVPLPDKCPVILEALSWSQTMAPVGDQVIDRHTMHVQSVSHWAPANIGPYSQAVRVGDIIHLAGQIALVPGSMTLVKGGIKQQCRLALRHVDRLLTGMDNNINVRHVVQGICYVTDMRFVTHARKLWEEQTNSAIVNYVVVSSLPRNSLVEWQVWAHRHNGQFEYEETGKCVREWSILIYRRWNYENNIATVVCHVDNTTSTDEVLPEDVFDECLDYSIQKLRQGHEHDETSIYNLKIFYPTNKTVYIERFREKIDEIRRSVSIVCTIVPVVGLSNKHMYLSVCGVRNQ